MIHTTLADIMTHSPVIISPEKTVYDAARLMKENKCGTLLVGTAEHAVGIITDRDIAIRVVAEGKDPAHTHIHGAMTRALYTCDVHSALEDVAEQMREHAVSRMVVTRDGRTNGIISIADLLKHAGRQKESDRILHTLLGSCRATSVESAPSSEASGGNANYDAFEGVF